MVKLFDKITGTTTSFDSEGVTDSTATWKTDQFKEWWVTIDGTEYLITSNNATKLFFSNSISSNNSYIIAFVGREFLTQTESDASNTIKIPDALIAKKYNQANFDLSNKIFSYLRGLYRQDFDPLEQIFNIYAMQQSFAYLVLAKIYQDLMIDQESFEGFKGYNMYEKSYNDGINDSLSLLQIDLDKDGVVDVEEEKGFLSSAILAR